MHTSPKHTQADEKPQADKDDSPIKDDQPIIDTSKMNQGQQAAMEVTEAARDTATSKSGLAGQLFLGRFDLSLLLPFPEQSADDQQIGHDMVQKVSAFLAQHLDPEEADATRTIPPHVVDGLTKLGVFRMKVPKEYGGLGFSQVNYNRVVMAIASFCGSTAVWVSAHQSIGAPQPLKMFGTEKQKAKYLPKISEGMISAFALTEPDVGSDPARMTTQAVLSDDGGHYVLNGTKLWTTNGPIAGLLVVMAKTAPKIVRGKERQQISAFIVETNCPGIQTVHRCDFMGLRAIQNGVIRFTNVVVPAENLLWGEGLGLKLAMKTLNTGRLTLPAACTGMAKQCLSIVRRWGNDRVQWGLPVGEHEVGQEKIAYIAATTYAMEAITWLTSGWADQGRDIRMEAAMAKLFCSEQAWKIVDMTMQFRGGRGYERASSLIARGETGYPVERMMRDCRINTIIEGTSEIMRLFLAREALDPHLQLASDILRRGATTTTKLKATTKLLSYYSRWYPSQWWGRYFGRPERSIAPFAAHGRYINRTAHRLAIVLFHAMVRHRQRLEKRQVLLGHLVDIGTELFAISAVCAYGIHIRSRDENFDGSQELTELFCRQASQRIENHFRAVHSTHWRTHRGVAQQVLAAQLRWLERGLIHTGPDT